MRIITRTEWGFDGWNGTPYTVNEATQRTEFFVHYDGGGAVKARTGTSVPRGIHAYHKSRGWKGIGYGHVVTSDGAIYEGRGFTYTGSHCAGHNTSGYSVQVHIGGSETPTSAQLASARWLYDEACRRSGRSLAKRGHRDGFATTCPGDNLYAWVRAGMPAGIAGSGGGGTTVPTGGGTSGGTTFEENDMELTDKIHLTDTEKRVWDVTELTAEDAFKSAVYARRFANEAKKDAAVARALIEAVARKTLTADEITAAIEAGVAAAIRDSYDAVLVPKETP